MLIPKIVLRLEVEGCMRKHVLRTSNRLCNGKNLIPRLSVSYHQAPPTPFLQPYTSSHKLPHISCGGEYHRSISGSGDTGDLVLDIQPYQ